MRSRVQQRARATLIFAVAALIGLVVVVGNALPAAASNPPVAISPDGITYGDSFPGQLFDGVVLIPGASATRSFWVKNTGPSGANLAITVIDVAALDPVVLSALTITAQAGTKSGSAGFDDVRDCVSLIHGIPLAQDADVRVDVTLTMANVGGTTAQGTSASFNLGVNLTSDEVPAPTGCVVAEPEPTPSASPDPPLPDTGGSVVVPGLPPAPTDPGPTATPSPLPTASPSAAPSPSPSPEPGEPPAVAANTERLHQEWFVAAWVIEFILGGYFAWRTARRRQVEGAQ